MMSTIIFIAGVLIGGCLGAGIMAFFHAQDDSSEDENYNICYNICEDCIHKSKRPWDEPCNSCDGYACNYYPEEE